MGNIQSASPREEDEKETKVSHDAGPQPHGDLFDELDVKHRGYLTLKELSVEKASAPSHSLPALFFCDTEKNGRITKSEFLMLVQFCSLEKKKVKAVLLKDKAFRELIQRASAAGVKDSSVPCRTNFRRLSSFKDVQSVYFRPGTPGNLLSRGKNSRPPKYAGPTSVDNDTPPTPGKLTRIQSVPAKLQETNANLNSAFKHAAHTTDSVLECTTVGNGTIPGPIGIDGVYEDSIDSTSSIDGSLGASREREIGDGLCQEEDNVSASDSFKNTKPCIDDGESDSETSSVSDDDDIADDVDDSRRGHCKTISMVSSRVEFDLNGNGKSKSPFPSKDLCSCEELAPESITALDAAAVENVMRTNISKLADLLHTQETRTQFMRWLCELADFNGQGAVGALELRIFFSALTEDGIDAEELAFYKTPGVPLEKRILNEFDTMHRGYLTKAEFLSLADLVTREYEFWECRHLERIGNYELGRTIGRGSSSVVRSAFNTETREKFAMKIIKKGTLSDLSRLDTEIQALMLVKHPNIVSLVEVLESRDNTFIVLELCGGGSLIDMVRIYPEEKMPEDTARYYVRQLFEALAYCHSKGICHRDVRPENMLLDNEGALKLADFGHSGLYTCGWDIFSSNLVGAVFNLSPEQIMSQPYSGEKIDVWSVGIAMYCLLVGRPPFFDPDPNRLLKSILSCSFSIPETVSRDAADLLRRAIHADASSRPSMVELLHHPWFFAGQEVAPVMNIVNIPVDRFFIRRPDLAVMVIARNIHHYNIHFHLGNTDHGPESYLTYRDWALKCHCAKKDMKFCVSLFTCDPYSMLPSAAGSDPRESGASVSGEANSQNQHGSSGIRGVQGPADSAPELLYKVFRDDKTKVDDAFSDDSGSVGGLCTPRKNLRLTRSRSLGEDLEGLLNVTRSATFDTFPFQRTFPQRRKPSKIPEFVQRKSLDDTSLYMSRRSRSREARRARMKSGTQKSRTSLLLNDDHSSGHTQSASSDEDQHLKADESIKEHITLHPSKAARYLASNMHAVDRKGSIAPPSPKLRPRSLFRSDDSKASSRMDFRDPATGIPARMSKITLGASPRSHSESWSCFDVIPEKRNENEFRPYLEVRLSDGESGLFMKICRRLKTICETELNTTAESHKERESVRKSSLMKRTNSLRAMSDGFGTM